MMSALDAMSGDTSLVGKKLSHGDKSYNIAKIDNFEYTDPIDGAVAKKQVRFCCTIQLDDFPSCTWFIIF